MRQTSSVPTDAAEDRLAALARGDKWYLADGCGAIWAPPFPVWLREPGFWDPANFFELAFGPLFCVAVVRADGMGVPLVQTRRDWRPDRLVSTYTTPDGMELTETKAVLPAGRFRSSWTWTGLKGTAFLVAYSAQTPQPDAKYTRTPDGRSIQWEGVATARNERSRSRGVELRLSAQASPDAPHASSVQRCQSTTCHPEWRLSPFPESWEPGVGLAPIEFMPGIDDRGLDWLGLSVGIEGETGQGVCFELDATLHEPGIEADLPSEQHWHEHFDSYPAFRCGDAFLERYFDYRVYGLHLCEVRGPAGNLKHPAVAEGIEYFHSPITYSGQCHMLETRWSRSPRVARGTLLNFLDNQKPDGSFHGRVYTSALINTDFYHANWGDALLAVDAIHPDAAFLRRGFDGLGRYFDWLTQSRDPEQTGTIEVTNHFETGQEYMSRYQAVNASADADGWVSRTRLKGVDATVYAYQLASALNEVALRLGDDAAASRYTEARKRIGSAITDRMWDPDHKLYSDLEPNGLSRTGVKAAVCFYPMLTDLPDTAQVDAMLGHLQNPDEFATPWPLPSSALDDPYFSADARWQGKRHLCPWNGRVWPMTTSHVIEGLIRQYKRRDALPDATRQRCGELAGQWIERFVRMMFHHGDLARPNCFEHYNPFTGQPCEYRGIDDYQHSWVVDLVITGMMGVSVRADRAGGATLTLDPLPGVLPQAEIHSVWVRGRSLTVHREGTAYWAELDGQRQASTIGQPIQFTLPPADAAPVILDAGRVPPPRAGKPTRPPAEAM
ncbi:MAG: MGH1-like glycoside hydrolase domain-containing protein [Phycisphaerales bacterium JB063]